ncbi:MAG: hypothetical protein GY696_38580 [Gammaproteobacteria bacterium]|nr:hypothetical protein [Gammaproteobacteria bacterium]
MSCEGYGSVVIMLVRDLEYEPETEAVTPSDGGSELETGHIKDDNDFYSPGPTERRDDWGDVVTHQDGKSFPGPRGLNTY